MAKDLLGKKDKKEQTHEHDFEQTELDDDLKTIAEYMLKTEKRVPDAVNLSIYNREHFERWNRNYDIKKEFVYFIKNGKYPEKPIQVCDWTAEKLFENYKKQLKWISVCYMVLMRLREEPEKWLDIIKKGFVKQ